MIHFCFIIHVYFHFKGIYLQTDRIKWNKKYTEKSNIGSPSRVVKRFYNKASGGRALDIAAGTGRNTLFLAENGFSVDAVDISDVGLKKITGLHANIHPVCIDLDIFEIPENSYNLIINIRFLIRRLFPYIINGLMPGGVLIFETYMEKEDSNYSSMNREYLLKPDELRNAFKCLDIMHYKEAHHVVEGNPLPLASIVGVKK